MKLLNQSLKYLSVSILFIVTVWAVFFYVTLINEIKESIDDGLENFKNMIVENARKDHSVLSINQFDRNLYSIREIKTASSLSENDVYKDTLIYIREPDDTKPDLETVRMLTTTFEIDGNDYELKVITSMVEKDELIDKLFWSVVWLFIILLLGIIVINKMVLGKLWKPFYYFLDQLKDYRLGNANARDLPRIKTKTREFSDMQRVVNNLLRHSITVFEQQKEFIGNASHELQTPLAIAITRLELILENDDFTDANAKKIAEVYQIIERLVRLNKSLLLLSKIDNKQFFDNVPVSVNEVVNRILEELDDMIQFKRLTCINSTAGELLIKMDPMLANIVISNLLKNALFHNTEGGRVEISQTGGSLRICNTGGEVPLETDEIFRRFQKSGEQTQGTGLGLPIVKAIANLYQIDVSYCYQNDMHCFKINFTSVLILQ